MKNFDKLSTGAKVLVLAALIGVAGYGGSKILPQTTAKDNTASAVLAGQTAKSDEGGIRSGDYYPTLASIRENCPDLVKDIDLNTEVEEGGINTVEYGYMLVITEKKPMPKGGYKMSDGPKTLASFVFAKEEKNWIQTMATNGQHCSIPR
jgi:hypothetical protein